MQGNNFSTALQAAGLGTPGALKRSYDFNPGVGGPIMRDRLWFHVAYKKQVNEVYPAGSFANLNANNPNVWTYVQDPSSRPFNAVDGSDLHMRLTWQVTSKLKFGVSDQGRDIAPAPTASAPRPRRKPRFTARASSSAI